MDAVDWIALSALAAIFLGGFGWCSHVLTNRIDRMETRMDASFTRVDDRFSRMDDRFERLEERYVRHLEQHTAR